MFECNELCDDWSRSQLLKFPQLGQYLESAQKRQLERFVDLKRESTWRHRREMDEIMRKIDNRMNLNRQLNNDPKYTGIGKNKPSNRNSLFGPMIMSRIILDANRIFRMQEKQSNQDSYEKATKPVIPQGSNDNLKRSIHNLYSKTDHVCDRHRRNLNRYENKELQITALSDSQSESDAGKLDSSRSLSKKSRFPGSDGDEFSSKSRMSVTFDKGRRSGSKLDLENLHIQNSKAKSNTKYEASPTVALSPTVSRKSLSTASKTPSLTSKRTTPTSINPTPTPNLYTKFRLPRLDQQPLSQSISKPAPPSQTRLPKIIK